MAPRGLVDLLQGIIPAEARDAMRSSGLDCALEGEGCELGDLVDDTDVDLLRDTLSSPAGLAHLERHRWWLARESTNLSGLRSGIDARMELLSQFRGGAS